MVDVAALVLALLVVLLIFLRKTSAGVGVLALLAGVSLDQFLASWLAAILPNQTNTVDQKYLMVVLHLLLTFVPVAISLTAVKVRKHNPVLALITGLALGFLLFYFGLKIVAPLPMVQTAAKNSGLLMFLGPYQNTILAASAVLALIEMIMSHRTKVDNDKKKK